MGVILFGFGIVGVLITLSILALKAIDEDILIVKIILVVLIIAIIAGLILGGLALGVPGINK